MHGLAVNLIVSVSGHHWIIDEIEKIEKVKNLLVFPNPMGTINQKNLWPTLIY